MYGSFEDWLILRLNSRKKWGGQEQVFRAFHENKIQFVLREKETNNLYQPNFVLSLSYVEQIESHFREKLEKLVLALPIFFLNLALKLTNLQNSHTSLSSKIKFF